MEFMVARVDNEAGVYQTSIGPFYCVLLVSHTYAHVDLEYEAPSGGQLLGEMELAIVNATGPADLVSCLSDWIPRPEAIELAELCWENCLPEIDEHISNLKQTRGHNWWRYIDPSGYCAKFIPSEHRREANRINPRWPED